MSELTITKENFTAAVLNSEKPVLLDFWATWCGPCKMLAPVVAQFAEAHPEIAVGKVNVDEEQELAAMHRIVSIPTLVVYRNGKAENQTVGYQSLSALEAFMQV